MTPDEKRISEIEQRVRLTICPTFGSAGETIEGRILETDFNYLMASLQGWKFTAKCTTAAENASPDDLRKALDSTMADWLKALDEIERLKANGARTVQ